MNMKHIPLMALCLTGLLVAGCAQETARTGGLDQQIPEMSEQARPETGEDENSQHDVEDMDDAIDIEGRQISTGKTELTPEVVKITSGGTYELSGTGSLVVVDAQGQDVTLVLDSVTLDNDSGPGIYVKKAENVTVTLKGRNTITTGSATDYEALNAALYSKADLKIDGDGSLTIQAGYGHGIKAKDSAEFDADLDIEAQTDGIHINDTGVFTGGKYRISAQSEGIESKDVLEIRDGTFQIEAVDDALNAASALTISGGTLDLVSQTNDAVDSNGTLDLSGGDITAIALRSPETAFDVDNTPFTISGGTIVGLGSQATRPTQASQPLLLVGAGGNVSSVKVEQNGKTVLEKTLDTTGSGSVLFLSAPEMKAGQTVTVYVNGQSLGEVTLQEGTTTLGSVSSMGGKGARQGMMPAEPGTENADPFASGGRTRR